MTIWWQTLLIFSISPIYFQWKKKPHQTWYNYCYHMSVNYSGINVDLHLTNCRSLILPSTCLSPRHQGFTDFPCRDVVGIPTVGRWWQLHGQCTQSFSSTVNESEYLLTIIAYTIERNHYDSKPQTFSVLYHCTGIVNAHIPPTNWSRYSIIQFLIEYMFWLFL